MSSQDKKKIIEEFFQLIMQGRPKDGLKFCSPECRQHNPYVSGGMGALFDAMSAVQREEGPKYPDPDFVIKNVVSEGDIVAVHSELLSSKSNPGLGGLRQVHIFRFGSDNKIVEYWDITQTITPDMPNAANGF